MRFLVDVGWLTCYSTLSNIPFATELAEGFRFIGLIQEKLPLETKKLVSTGVFAYQGCA